MLAVGSRVLWPWWCFLAVAGAEEACSKSGTCAERSRKGDHMLMQLKPQLKRGIEEAVPSAALSLPACCLGCAASWCSPKSGRCHDSKAKTYYKPCAVSTHQPTALLWADEFDGTEVNLSNWVHVQGMEEVRDGLLHYTDRRTNSFVENGVLKIVAGCEDSERGTYASAKLSTQNRFDWGPGHRLEIRARVPRGRGLWPAVWMLPSKGARGGIPATGEIDIMEVSGCAAGQVFGAVHTAGAFNQMKTESSQHFVDYENWHTYTIDWMPDHINWYVDGQLYHVVQQPQEAELGPWPFRDKFFLNMNLAVNAPWASHCHDGKALSCEDLGQAMEVDYVRVHELQAQ